MSGNARLVPVKPSWFPLLGKALSWLEGFPLGSPFFLEIIFAVWLGQWAILTVLGVKRARSGDQR
jgi:hypothetical protein